MSIDIPTALWPVIVDPAEFELALLNIGVNARDAMPNGGQFPGRGPQHLARPAGGGERGAHRPLCRPDGSDTGTGMAPDVLARAFEPFFTTKQAGLARGLGSLGLRLCKTEQAVLHRSPAISGKGTAITLVLPPDERIFRRAASYCRRSPVRGRRLRAFFSSRMTSRSRRSDRRAAARSRLRSRDGA